jgi:2-polyprenyl-6-methoxyphenol hydroxylase-like FAD-dependent oxidoreductase
VTAKVSTVSKHLSRPAPPQNVEQALMRALVVGGGLGGVTVAHALRTIGYDVQVFEQAEDPRRLYVGSGIHVWNNAMAALDSIGLADRVLEATGPDALMKTMEALNPRGKVLAQLDVDDIAKRTGSECVCVNRAELLPILAGALEPKTVVGGARLTGFAQDHAHVAASFADGREESADLLIGADGMQSTVRAALGDSRTPVYAGYAVWQGITDFPDESVPPGLFRIHFGPGCRFVYFRVDRERLCWAGVANATEGEADPAEERLPLLLERYRGWPAPIERIIESTSVEAVGRRDVYYLEPADSWGSGRVTLMGDAAHAMTFDTGQGAGQGMEDAAVLVRCLRDAADIPTALKEYERARIPRVTHIQKMSRAIGASSRWRNPLACRARDALTQFIFSFPISKRKFRADLEFPLDR